MHLLLDSAYCAGQVLALYLGFDSLRDPVHVFYVVYVLDDALGSLVESTRFDLLGAAQRCDLWSYDPGGVVAKVEHFFFVEGSVVRS